MTPVKANDIPRLPSPKLTSSLLLLCPRRPLAPSCKLALRSLCHLESCRMSDIENSQKVAEVPSGAWAKCQQNSRRTAAGKQSKHPRKQLFWLFFQLFLPLAGTDLATFFGCFPAVFNAGHSAPLWTASEIAKLAGTDNDL